MRKVVGSLAHLAAVALGVAGIVYVAIETPQRVEYVPFVILAALGLITVSGGELGETWTGWRRRRHYALGVASLFGGLGGLALLELIRADDAAEAIIHALAVLILLPFALVVLLGWLRFEEQS